MKQVDKMYPDPLHFPTLPLEGETDSGFTRTEIIDFYILFKTLCKLSLLEAVVNGDQHPVIGVNESTFRNYIKQLCFEHDDMCARFFEVANTEKDGYRDWYQFFEAMKILKTTDLKTKIDRFFKIIDSDGNGMFDFDEVSEICKMSLAKFTTQEGIELRDIAGEYFTDLIFKAFDVDPEELQLERQLANYMEKSASGSSSAL